VTGLRKDRALLSLVADHHLDSARAGEVVQALESAPTIASCWAIVFRATKLPPDKVRPWLATHGYVAQPPHHIRRMAS
jgi:hypothetical protein